MFETGQVFQMIRRASASVGIAASLGLAAAVPPSYGRKGRIAGCDIR
jgi:hypothetical protein